jgi:Immunity protein Imm1
MPFIETFTLDHWFIDGRVEEEEITYNTLEQAIGAIRQLDGKQRTMVTFEGPSRSMTIGGGNDGRYLVFIAYNIDEVFFLLTDPTKPSHTEVKIVAAGQTGLRPERQLVTRETAEDALRHFAISGEPSPLLTWERQG